ncbi:unnamed protein product [Symbiodinium natans]|uniref:Uncharacterized protein n=1 Tax=Symbiodinium natans TaxID=878477 RepID=A0A812N7Y7_9DINO|nr:unnamed protein product [Symbiodinium natans]
MSSAELGANHVAVKRAWRLGWLSRWNGQDALPFSFLCVCVVNGAPRPPSGPSFNEAPMRRSVAANLLKPWFLLMLGMTLTTLCLAVPKKRRPRRTPLAEEDARETQADRPPCLQHRDMSPAGMLPADPGLPSESTDGWRYSQPPNILSTGLTQGTMRTPHLDDAQAFCTRSDRPREDNLAGESHPEHSLQTKEATHPSNGSNDKKQPSHSESPTQDGKCNFEDEDVAMQKDPDHDGSEDRTAGQTAKYSPELLFHARAQG